MKTDEELKEETTKDLIAPTFRLISNLVAASNFTADWTKGAEGHEIKFTGPKGESGEFSIYADTRRATPEAKKAFPVVILHWRRDGLNVTDSGHTRVKGLTPERLLLMFKGIFIPWFNW